MIEFRDALTDLLDEFGTDDHGTCVKDGEHLEIGRDSNLWMTHARDALLAKDHQLNVL